MSSLFAFASLFVTKIITINGIIIAESCRSVPRILKLLCYKIGMDNEELRADRNKYVTILSKNVLPGQNLL